MRKVKSVLSFKKVPKQYWWRPDYSDEVIFDIDNHKHLKFLREKGVCDVVLENGLQVDITKITSPLTIFVKKMSKTVPKP